MSGSEDLIRKAELLPVDERLRVVDSLLRSLNPPDPDIDRLWIDEARRRLDEVRSGNVVPIDGAEVIQKLRERFPNA